MLNGLQRGVLFWVFCLIILVSLGLSSILVWAMVERGFTGGKAVSALLSTGLFGGCCYIFQKMIRANFLDREALPMARLHELAANRSNIIENARHTKQDIYQTRRALITNTLKFAEETLRNWLRGSHFEYCVFIDADNPVLFSYFDSNRNEVARSMAGREREPAYYVEKGYEVTKVLKNLTSQPRVIEDTSADGSKYVFTSKEQRNQLRSTLLLCLDLGVPCALVVSSNAKNAISATDDKLMSFIRYIGELIRFDLFDSDFIYAIKSIKPELFPNIDQQLKLPPGSLNFDAVQPPQAIEKPER